MNAPLRVDLRLWEYCIIFIYIFIIDLMMHIVLDNIIIQYMPYVCMYICIGNIHV